MLRLRHFTLLHDLEKETSAKEIEEIDLQLYGSQQFVEPVWGRLTEWVESRDLPEEGRLGVPWARN